MMKIYLAMAILYRRPQISLIRKLLRSAGTYCPIINIVLKYFWQATVSFID